MFFLLFPMHTFRLECGFDRHWLHRPEQLPCDRGINPQTAEGQIHGGVVHGIGNALFEWMGYDANAQPFTMTLAEYLLPTAPEMPPPI